MGRMEEVRRSRRIAELRSLTRDLRCWTVRQWSPLVDWREGDRVISPGETWALERRTYHLKCPSLQIPEHWPLSDSYLELSAFGYGIVRIQSEDGASHARQLNEYMRIFELPGRRCTVDADISPIRDRSKGFLTLGDTWMARVIWIDRAVERLCFQLTALSDSANEVADDRIAHRLLSLAEAAVATIRWPSKTADFVSRIAHLENLKRHWSAVSILVHPEPLSDAQGVTVEAASQLIEDGMRDLAEQYPAQGSVALIGYAHTDIEWMWPEHVSVPAIVGQFATALAQLSRFPGMRFGQAGAYLYSLVEEADPALFAVIKQYVAEGRWDLLTGMWVEPDANLLGGESIARQLLHGQAYFMSRFGRRSRTCWLPDTFGFAGSLPQVLAGSGVEYFFTTKLAYSDTNPYPYNLFNWEGIDGTQILSYSGNAPEGYQCIPDAKSISGIFNKYHQAALFPSPLQPIGYANGIGPTDADVTAALTLTELPEIPAVKFTSATEYFDAAAEEIQHKAVPVWRGELYLEAHRGTYTTQGRTKVLHRRAESALVTAEVAMAMREIHTGQRAESLSCSWRRLLRKQSHDIVAGSSSGEVHLEAERELAQICDEADSVMARALESLAVSLTSGEAAGTGGLLFLNPTFSWRQARGIVPDGSHQGQRAGNSRIVASHQMVAPLGAAWSCDWPAPGVRADGSVIENELLRVTVADDGSLAGVRDKRSGREILSSPGNVLRAYLDRPHFWDAWELSSRYRQFEVEAPQCSNIEVCERGPHRAAIRVEYTFRDSTIRQEIRLWAGSARLDFDTLIDWHERRLLLRTYFPTTIHASHASYECPFGAVQRSVTATTAWERSRFEVPAYRFADVTDDGQGVALLNNGRFGYKVADNVMSLSLLRSPVFPDPFADEGEHHFQYSLLPHQGDWLTGGVLAEAEDLNAPLPCVEVSSAEAGNWQAAMPSGIPLALGTLKARETGPGLVIRVYEPIGRSGDAAMRFSPGWRVTSEMNILEDVIGDPQYSFSPFKLRTWLVRSM